MNLSMTWMKTMMTEPRFYEGFADMMQNDELSVFNWIWCSQWRIGQCPRPLWLVLICRLRFLIYGCQSAA